MKYNMKQEDKELLLKDLCGRLPYGVICEDEYGNVLELNGIDKPNTITFKCAVKSFWTTDLDKCKPYLLPLSSMTEEQAKELFDLFGICISISDSMKMDYIKIDEGITFFLNRVFDVETHLDKLVDWLNANHFDYRGLIPMDLAIDATDLNIY